VSAEVVVGLAAVGLGLAFVLKPRWWAEMTARTYGPSDSERSVKTIYYVVMGAGLLVLMAVVIVSRAT
jgi:hypothetical protein